MIWYALGLIIFIITEIAVSRDDIIKSFFWDSFMPFILIVVFLPSLIAGLFGAIFYSNPNAENRNYKTETYILKELDKDTYLWYNRNEEVFYYSDATGLVCDDKPSNNRYELTDETPHLTKIIWTTFKAGTAPWWLATSWGNKITEDVYYLNTLNRIIL